MKPSLNQTVVFGRACAPGKQYMKLKVGRSQEGTPFVDLRSGGTRGVVITFSGFPLRKCGRFSTLGSLLESFLQGFRCICGDLARDPSLENYTYPEMAEGQP